MKRILPLLTLALLGAAAPAFADFNFEVQWKQYDHKVYEGVDGRYFTIKVTGDPGEKGNIYITDIFNNFNSANQTDALDDPGLGVTDFGFTYSKTGDTGVQSFSLSDAGNMVSLDSDPDMHTYTYYDENGEKQSRTRNAYNLGEFTAGDEIQVYLQATLPDESGNNNTMSVTSNNPNGEYNSKTNARVDLMTNWRMENGIVDQQLQVASLYLQKQVNFGIMGATADGNYVYGSSKEVSVGSPLPGGLPVILVSGLVALGFWFFRRKKAVAV